MYPMVIYENPLHFKVGLLTILLIFELDKCILKTVSGALVPYHLTGYDGAEPTEYGV